MPHPSAGCPGARRNGALPGICLHLVAREGNEAGWTAEAVGHQVELFPCEGHRRVGPEEPRLAKSLQTESASVKMMA